MLVFRGGKQIHEEHTLYIPSHLLIRYLEETCAQSATKPDVLRDMFFFQHKSWILREMLLRLLRVGANFLSPRGQDAYGHGQQWVTNNWTKKPDVFLETACGNVGISIFLGGRRPEDFGFTKNHWMVSWSLLICFKMWMMFIWTLVFGAAGFSKRNSPTSY